MDLDDLLRGRVDEVARRLLGCGVTHGEVTVRLTEVEAYGGTDDPGSHAFAGPRPRNRTMFGPPGLLYVYVAYGMHSCANVVCGPAGEASAVLLRAGEVVSGHELARSRRPGCADRDLARGPGNLCRALDVTRALDGRRLQTGPVLLSTPGAVVGETCVGPRVGLRRAADRPWRMWVDGDPTVSSYRRHRGALAEG